MHLSSTRECFLAWQSESSVLLSARSGIVKRSKRVIVHANERNQTRGQVFAFGITLVVLVGGIILIALGRSVEGLAALLVPLAGIAGVFIYNEVRTRSERRRAQLEFADFEQD